MIPLALDRVSELCPGRLQRAPEAVTATGVEIDSRRISPGDLFVAVGAGDAFVDDALARGASAALVPDDVFDAMAALGREARGSSSATVVAITGSTGKTSTKDILSAICAPRRRTIAAEASYNNELGVPLTLCRVEPDTEVVILELAMRGIGQIAELAEMARPDIGVITNVGPAHLELVGSLEGVVRAKSELMDALPAGGTAIVPMSFPVERDDIGVVRVGKPDATVVDGATHIRFGGREVTFPFAARHQAENALYALHVVRALGIEVEGRVEVAFSPWRDEEVDLPGDGVLVNDAYNANPISMRAALEALVERADGRRTVAVLGEMAELGPESVSYHEQIGALIAELGIDVLIAVGDPARAYLGAASGAPVAEWVATAADAIAEARRLVKAGDCVLVKGSRVAGLETVAAALVEQLRPLH